MLVFGEVGQCLHGHMPLSRLSPDSYSASGIIVMMNTALPITSLIAACRIESQKGVLIAVENAYHVLEICWLVNIPN